MKQIKKYKGKKDLFIGDTKHNYYTIIIDLAHELIHLGLEIRTRGAWDQINYSSKQGKPDRARMRMMEMAKKAIGRS